MTRRSFLVHVLVLTFLFATTALFAADDDYSGQWWLDKRTGSGNSARGYCVTLRYEKGNRFFGSYSNWENSVWIETAQLRGFNEQLLSSSGTQASFDIVRDPGTFHAQGWFSGGKGSGHYTFEANQRYIQELEKRGVGTPTPDQQMQMALNNMSLELVDLLKKSGYTFDITELVRASNHGVDLEYVKGMNALGYKPDTLAGLTRMRDHGVDPEYVRVMADAGLKNLSDEDIVKMRDHGVDPAFIRGLADHGVKGLSGQELAHLRDHGVDAQYIASFQKMDPSLSTNDFVRLRDHGVDVHFAAEVRKAGFNDVTVNELVRMRDHGVDSRFVTEVHDAGLKDVSIDDLVRLRDHGVDGSFIREHGKDRTIQEIIRLRERGGYND